MKTHEWQRRLCPILLVGGVVGIFSLSVTASEKSAPPTQKDKAFSPDAVGEADARGTPLDLAAGYADGPFERYIDLIQVGSALQGGSAEVLIDLALQLAEGERILLRQHKSGLTPRALAHRAMAVAVEKRDMESLRRLAAWAEHAQDEEFLSQVQASQKLAGAARKTNPALQINLETMGFEEMLVLKDIHDALQTARRLHDVKQLAELEDRLKGASELKAVQKEALAKEISEARKELPKELDETDELMLKLASSSRNVFDNTPFDTKTWGPIGGSSPQIQPAPTQQGLWGRNRTNKTIYLALAYLIHDTGITAGETPDQFWVAGWYSLPANKDTHILNGNLRNRYYYIYAYSSDSRWEGNAGPYYVHPTSRFGYDARRSTASLPRQGYVRHGFRTIDTGAANGYFINFTR